MVMRGIGACWYDSRRPLPVEAMPITLADSRLLVLDRRGLNRLIVVHPEAAMALLLALGRAQAHELRWNTVEMLRLIEW